MKNTSKIKESKSYWIALKKVGWLDYVPASEHKSLRESIETAIKHHGIKFAFLGLTHLSFDFECIFDDDSYPTLVSDFASFSRSQFNPKNVRSHRDSKNKKKRLVQFSVGRKRYSLTVDFAGDYADESIIDLVNTALADSGSQYRYQNLPAVDQCGYLTFVPHAIYEAAVKIGVIPTQQEVDSLLGLDDDD